MQLVLCKDNFSTGSWLLGPGSSVHPPQLNMNMHTSCAWCLLCLQVFTQAQFQVLPFPVSSLKSLASNDKGQKGTLPCSSPKGSPTKWVIWSLQHLPKVVRSRSLSLTQTKDSWSTRRLRDDETVLLKGGPGFRIHVSLLQCTAFPFYHIWWDDTALIHASIDSFNEHVRAHTYQDV